MGKVISLKSETLFYIPKTDDYGYKGVGDSEGLLEFINNDDRNVVHVICDGTGEIPRINLKHLCIAWLGLNYPDVLSPDGGINVVMEKAIKDISPWLAASLEAPDNCQEYKDAVQKVLEADRCAESKEGMVIGDFVEFFSDVQTEKGPSTGTVTERVGDRVMIKHSDHSGESFDIKTLQIVSKVKYDDRTHWGLK
jgi:hypothetical protein